MNLKKLSILFLIGLTLILSIGVISAADGDVVQLATSESDNVNVVGLDTTEVKNEQTVINADVKKTTEATIKPKIKTKVDADQVAVTYKKNKYFKVKIEERMDDDIPASHAKLKIKVGTGSKAKTFSVKTNAYGVAKINTKSLKVGAHKVTITSDDDRYEIQKTSKIFVGKLYTKTIKSTSKKATLKKGDVIKLRTIYDDDDRDVKVVHKKSKHTKILKAKFYFKNKFTGRTMVKTSRAEFDDGRWDMPDADYSPYRFSFVKVKVYYIAH